MECKYILYDVLETVKNMTANYATALNEASSEVIYKEFKKEFDSLSNLAKELFNYAYSVNWYKLEEAQSKKIDTAIKNMKNELEC